MVKRVVSLLAAVFMVCASSFSASAWDADSFVADSSNYYKMFPARMPSISTIADDSSSDSGPSLTAQDIFTNGHWVTHTALNPFIHVPEWEAGLPGQEIPIPEMTLWLPYPSDSSLILLPESVSDTDFRWVSDFISVPESLLDSYNDASFLGVSGLYGTHVHDEDIVDDDSGNTWFSLEYSIDLSSLGSFDTFEIGGYLQLLPMVRRSDTAANGVVCQRLDLYVNGALFQSFPTDKNGHCDIPLTIISMPDSVSSLSLVSVYSLAPLFDWSSSYSYAAYAGCWLHGDSSDVHISVIGSNEALDGYTDEAQDSINQHDQIEADWVGQMDENFNSLDLDTASYPSGLVSGFQLLSGIFMDIWNGLGDLHLIFTIPLTLGIVLVLIGRISKAVSNRSGRAEEKGDNSA